MKKLTLVIGALFLFAALVNAQNSALRTSVKSVPGKSLHVPNYGSVLTTTCDTAMPAAVYTGTCIDSLTVYYMGTGGDTGYIAGQNVYGFSASAEKYAATPGGSISGVIVWWALKKGTTGTTSAAIYTVGANGGPGTQIGSGSTTIDKSAIDTLGFGAGFHNMYSFTTPPSSSAPFFVVVSYPTTFTFGSDELGMAELNQSCSNISGDSTGWLDYPAYGGWLSYKHAFKGANFDLGIFPIVCKPTGVNNVNLLDNNIVVYPNPVNNQFTVQFIGNEQKDVVISVYNAIGQLVKNVSANNSIDHAVIDMSDVAKGIYIVNIKTSEGNAVKRVSVVR